MDLVACIQQKLWTNICNGVENKYESYTDNFSTYC